MKTSTIGKVLKTNRLLVLVLEYIQLRGEQLLIEQAPRFKQDITYDEAWLYCATLTHNNNYDWRLPTHKEYMNCEHIVGWFKDRDSWGDFPIIPVRDKQ